MRVLGGIVFYRLLSIYIIAFLCIYNRGRAMFTFNHQIPSNIIKSNVIESIVCLHVCVRACKRARTTSIVYMIQVFYIPQSYCLSESRKATTQSYFTLDLTLVVLYYPMDSVVFWEYIAFSQCICYD
jgi:hypothetical protein